MPENTEKNENIENLESAFTADELAKMDELAEKAGVKSWKERAPNLAKQYPNGKPGWMSSADWDSRVEFEELPIAPFSYVQVGPRSYIVVERSGTVRHGNNKFKSQSMLRVHTESMFGGKKLLSFVEVSGVVNSLNHEWLEKGEVKM